MTIALYTHLTGSHVRVSGLFSASTRVFSAASGPESLCEDRFDTPALELDPKTIPMDGYGLDEL